MSDQQWKFLSCHLFEILIIFQLPHLFALSIESLLERARDDDIEQREEPESRDREDKSRGV